jgi:hypothetical protein
VASAACDGAADLIKIKKTEQTMKTAPQIGTHNACASGKTTGEGNRIRFPKQIQGDARVAEYAVGMTEDRAVFRAECAKKLL